ncbi:myotubularin-related protein 3-like, partial [Notothenia coriiceps]|uniref:Myotubularin-related protein 3-like n=1 Tax=Notothenia coriiceps TaxID=8208 RepID=A0A6I9P0Y7_9TELE
CAVVGSSRKHLTNGGGGYSNGTDLPDTDFESSMTHSTEVETLASQPHKLLILDARSYAAAVANRAKGGGCECPEYYPNCEVVFMGMANIHSIRKSFQSLRFLCTQMPDPSKYVSLLLLQISPPNSAGSNSELCAVTVGNTAVFWCWLAVHLCLI